MSQQRFNDPQAAYAEAQHRIRAAAETQETYLNLAGLGLANVPLEIGQLTQLTNLVLYSNQLTSVPPEIGQLTQLTELDLSSNRLSSLPENLRRLSNLKVLFLHGNPKLKLPASVLGTSVDDWIGNDETAPKPRPILDYYFRTRAKAERRPLCEGKLILVGRGDVGKTSLVRRLVDNKFSRREDTTQGIKIRHWPLLVGKKREQMRLHVWEFEPEIADKLNEADIVLLLISPDFVDSTYCFEIEMQAAMQAREDNDISVLPIIVRETHAWKKLPAGKLTLGKLNALPTSGKPIPDWKTADKGWANVAAGVQRAAEELLKRKGYTSPRD